MKLIQLLVPLNDNNGKQYPVKMHEDIKDKLIKKHGGVTAFTQSPAEGVWDSGQDRQIDQNILYEVMTDNFEKDWWTNFITELETRLHQEKIILRWFEISVL